MTESHRIAIRGVGVIGPGAIGAGPFSDLLAGEKSAIEKIDQFDTSDLGSHCAGLVREFRPRDFIVPMRMRRMSALSRMAVAATKLALDDAAMAPAEAAALMGVSLGSAFGAVSTSFDYLTEYVAKGPSLTSPQLFAESVANAPGSHMAIEFGLRGFNVTFTQRSGSAAHAVAYAALQLLKGAAAGAIAGGADELHEITFAVLDRIGALAHSAGDLDEAMRPFDRSRNGLTLGEGAAMFVLGREEGIASPWGFVAGAGFAKDRTASISDWGTDDEAVERAMRDALSDAVILPEQVDAIWASANGSTRGDRLEASALRRIWPLDAMPPVVATKGFFGEYAGAGALHIASALVAIREQAIPGSLGFAEAEAGLELPISRERRDLQMAHVLLNAVSEGGGIVSLVLSRDGSRR